MIILCSIIFAAGLSCAAPADYDNKIALEQISFEWRIDGKEIHIRLAAETAGWVGIGINPTDPVFMLEH